MNTTIETKKAYTFRRLNSTDMFLMFKIIGKIGINEFTACFDGDAMAQMMRKTKGKKIDDSVSLMGFAVILDIANVIVGNLPKCEAEIFEMLANVSDMSVEDIRGMDMVTFAEMVIDFIKKDEFKDFIGVVSKLFK